MTAPDVRVGIVSYETAEELERCLSALPSALEGCSYEVVVVDNASRDSSRDVARRFPFVRLVENEDNVGYARAMNRALDGSSARALLALNPDTVPEPGSLARLVAALDGDPGLGLAVPVLHNADGSLQHSVHRFPGPGLALVQGLVPPRLRAGRLGRRLWLEGFADHDRAADVDWAIGAVHCVRRAAVERPGVYDERWFMYVEDMELCWYLRQGGWQVRLEPAAVVTHVGNVAGERVFGAAAREERWLDALYDWYVSRRGAGRARVYALANMAGLSVKVAVASRSDDVEHRRWLRLLRDVHARRVRQPRTTGLSLRRPA
ncbi:MAG: putative glycosyltransferase [Frankiales bacterium]|nr:putative glycosyltransferase [Frankiales bacterium]